MIREAIERYHLPTETLISREQSTIPSQLGILEFGYQAEWWQLHLAEVHVSIPKDCLCVTIQAVNNYSFVYCGIFDGSTLTPHAETRKEGSVSFLTLAITDKTGIIPRPTTLVLEDGRVFFDTSLDHARLDAILGQLSP